MANVLSSLGNADLRALIDALGNRRVAPPYSALLVRGYVSASQATEVATALSGMAEAGFTEKQVAIALRMIVDDRDGGGGRDLPIDLVVSGPEAPGVANRDTAVVVRELFAHAQKSVMVVGYAVYQGQEVFEALAKRMEQMPELTAKFFLEIARPDRDTTQSEILVSRYKQRFIDKQWPAGCKLPEVYYDPRSVSDDEKVRSSLHAKCVVIDEKDVFVSSANFTKAGQERNIEVGLKIESPALAKRLINHFNQLAAHKLAVRAF